MCPCCSAATLKSSHEDASCVVTCAAGAAWMEGKRRNERREKRRVDRLVNLEINSRSGMCSRSERLVPFLSTAENGDVIHGVLRRVLLPYDWWNKPAPKS